MDQGKPARTKWWSRPRPDGAESDPGTPVPSDPEGTPETGLATATAHDGDFELERPLPRATEAGADLDAGSDLESSGPAPASDADPDSGDDFELSRPVPATGAGAGADSETESGGPVRASDADADPGDDFELSRPLPASAADSDSGSGGGVPASGDDSGADFELSRPAAADARADGDFELARPGADPGTSVQVPEAASAPVPDPVSPPVSADVPHPAPPADAAVAPVGAPAERPRPLHAPDPYSTPPYGEPGPWAPAPPVQHPRAAATPPAVPPGASSAPLPVTQAPHPAASQIAPPPVAQGVPHPAVPHGTDPGVAAPVPAPVQGVPQGTGVAPAPLPAVGTGGAAPHVPMADGGAGAGAEGPAPWRNYDPWAASGPLQLNGAAVPSRNQRRRKAKRILIGGALLIALLSGGVGGLVGAYLERNGGMVDVELPQAGKEPNDRAPGTVAGIAAGALPGVVTLHVRGSEDQGTGTGFVLDGAGHILTNNHVVEPAGKGGEITVTFSGGESATAEVVGRDSGYDLAVVRVSSVSGLKPLPLGNSDNVQVGDAVVAIGAPFDLPNTVTSGIISAKERPITAGGEKGGSSDVSYVDALQTDAPINPGNSGGPLLDSKGRVIGINSAIRSADSSSDLEGGQSGSIGLGFAIPVNQGKRVAEELINTGRATHPVIGVTLDMDYGGDGARVGTKADGGGAPVTPGGPGDRAGIRAGDVITEVDGRPVHSGEELIVRIRAHRPGDRLELTLERDGTEKPLTLVLGSADGD
ncbi:trypsin-like peptidase domain-containing protein [Streptomyces sp. NPDC005481]|uniref:S1C family serine protease n=1 Tax=Streptomyces sp. NPDC005481 TaxID=3154881 RepID=UPI0033B77ABD